MLKMKFRENFGRGGPRDKKQLLITGFCVSLESTNTSSSTTIIDV